MLEHQCQSVRQTVSRQTVSEADSQSVTQAGRQAGRQKHPIWFFGGSLHLRVMGSSGCSVEWIMCTVAEQHTSY